MSFCPKCGAKVREDMSFCPKCGTALKVEQPTAPAAPAPTAPPAPSARPTYERREKQEKQEKQEKGERPEKHEKGEKTEKHEKREGGYIGTIIGGIILIALGIIFYLTIIMPTAFSANTAWAIFLVVIGIIIIIGAIYAATMASRRHPPT